MGSSTKGILIVTAILIVGLIPEFGWAYSDANSEYANLPYWEFDFFGSRLFKYLALSTTLGGITPLLFKSKSIWFQFSVLFLALFFDFIASTSIYGAITGKGHFNGLILFLSAFVQIPCGVLPLLFSRTFRVKKSDSPGA